MEYKIIRILEYKQALWLMKIQLKDPKQGNKTPKTLWEMAFT